VKAKTTLGLETAISHLEGRFSSIAASIRDELSRLLAQIEVEIDFPDADLEPKSQQELLGSLIILQNRIAEIIARGEEGKIVKEGLVIVILGRTNVGKSTLFNALLQEERAIVTSIPGTTRDTLEETIVIDGIPFRLIDTAGLRRSSNVVEKAGIKRTKQAQEIADLVLFVIDNSLPITDDDRRLAADLTGKKVILLLNKSDLPVANDNIELAGEWKKIYPISARDGTGLNALKEGIIDLTFSGEIPEKSGILLLDAWEQDLLRRAGRSVSHAIKGLQNRHSIDMVAEDIRAAYVASTQLQGIDVTEELLNRIFADFCIGK
jgi:tRNA modification GTPase